MSDTTKAEAAAGKSGLRIPGFAHLQRLGKSLMLPIAVLPAAGILLRLGQDDLLGRIKAPVIGPFFQAMSAAGGALLDMAVYHISLILYLLDNPAILTVSGGTHQQIDMYADRRQSSGYDVEELGMAYVRLEGGISLWVEESWAIHQDAAPGDRIMGTKGGLKLDPLSYFTTMSDLEMDATFDVERANWRRHQCIPNQTGYDSPQHNWIWGLLDRVPMIDTAAVALATARLTEGIYASSRLGREVTADEIEAGIGSD